MKTSSTTTLVLTALLALGAGSLAGCEEKPPNVPQTPGGVDPMTPPKPGSGQAQFGVADPVPEGAAQMNAQAAAFYAQAMVAWANGDLKQAQAFFKQSTDADPKAFQAWYSLGVVQERLGSGKSALASYEKAFTAEPEYDRAMIAYGMLLAKQGSLSEADAFLTKKRSRLSKSAGLAAALAEVKSLQKDTASAQNIAQEALKIDPAYSPAMMTIARDHYRNRRLDLALYALKAILDGFGGDNPPRDKDNAEAHLLRAFIWAEQENRVLAMEAFRRALDLRPDLVVARLRLATYLLESGGASEALPMLQKAIQFDADNLTAHLSLGDAYRLTGQYPQAKAELDWVKGKDANLPELHFNYGLLYLFAPSMPGMSKKQQVVAAIAAFEKFKELRSKSDRSDVDELLNRANLKKAEIEALEKAKNPQAVAPVPSASASAAASAAPSAAPDADEGGE